MKIVDLREQLHEQIDRLPDDMVEQIADFTMYVMARRRIAPVHDEWGTSEWQAFVLDQFYREDDEVTYTLEEAKEVYKP